MAKVGKEPGEEAMRAAKIGRENSLFPGIAWIPQRDPGNPGNSSEGGKNIERQTNQSQSRLFPREPSASFWQAQRIFGWLPGKESYSPTYF